MLVSNEDAAKVESILNASDPTQDTKAWRWVRLYHNDRKERILREQAVIAKIEEWQKQEMENPTGMVLHILGDILTSIRNPKEVK